MTPEQKAELRRQCEAECDNRYIDPVMLDYERLLAWKTDVYTMGLIRKACAEILYAERLHVDPLIEAGNELHRFMAKPIALSDEGVKHVKDQWIAALTVYQNTDR